ETHLTGMVRSVELAAVGRRVAEVEWDLVRLLEEAGA
ncbi:MAG: acyl-CoA dehydrogenase, partial [Acidimicrobiia bacterium]